MYEPAVTGLDVTFEKPKEHDSDSLLAEAIASSENIVLASYFTYPDEDAEMMNGYVASDLLFRKDATEGFINFPSHETEGTIRHFTPRVVYNDKEYTGFSARIVSIYDQHAYEKLAGKKAKAQHIDYKGNTESFIVFDTDEVYPGNHKLEVIKDKIVLLGFMGPDLETKVMEDIHFTPLNRKYSGRSYPDMYGVVIHANIISTILKGSYLVKMPLWISLALAFIITYACMYLFIRLKTNWKIWFPVIVRIFQLIASILIVALDLYLFRKFSFKMDAVVIIVPILLSIDLLEIYERISLWLHKKFHFQTLFLESH
jgi:CHASE2 domain-containing sensor protein